MHGCDVRVQRGQPGVTPCVSVPDLTTLDVARELNASTETVRALIASGDLKAYRLRGASGPFRVQPAAVEEYRERQRTRDPWARTRSR